MEKRENAQYMSEYLKYALEFEKYVYIWSRAKKQADESMETVYSRRNQLKQLISSTTNSLNGLANVNDDAKIQAKEKEARAAEASAKKTKRVVVVELAILIVIGLVVGIAMAIGMSHAEEGNAFLKLFIVPMMLLAVVFIGFITTWIGPICAVLHITSKCKAQRLRQEIKALVGGSEKNSRRRQSVLLESKIQQAKQESAAVEAKERALGEKQDEIMQALRVAKKNLSDLYAQNVLPEKYRNINAVATLYEYLAIPKYTTVYWSGGSIYSEYDKEQMEIMKLSQLMEINAHLENIEHYQRYICQELTKANATLSKINNSMKEIERTNAQIAQNTAISAAANQQTAAAAQYMAFEMHFMT